MIAAVLSLLRTNRRGIALMAGMCLLYLFSYFQRVGVPGTIFDELQGDFRLTAGGVSALGAVFLYVYGVLQIPTGIMADRFGGARVLLAGGILLTVGSAAFPLARSAGALYAARALVGVGSGLIYVSILKEVNELFAARDFALVLSAVLFVGYSGGLVGTLPFERAAHAWGWRQTLLGMAILCAAALAVYIAVLGRTGYARSERAVPTSLVLPLRSVLGNRRGYPILIAMPLQFSLYFVVQGPIGKKMLQDVSGIPSVTAASVTFAMMVIAIACTSTSGLLSRLLGDRRRPLAITGSALAVASVLGILLATRLAATPAALTGFCLLLAFSTVGSTMFLTSFKELNAGKAAGTAVGVLNCGTYMAIALLSNGAGWALDRFQGTALRTASSVIYPRAAYTALFAVCLAIAGLAFLATLFITETGGEAAARLPEKTGLPISP